MIVLRSVFRRCENRKTAEGGFKGKRGGFKRAIGLRTPPWTRPCARKTPRTPSAVQLGGLLGWALRSDGLANWAQSIRAGAAGERPSIPALK